MARKVGQIITRGDRRWLIRVYVRRDRETNKRKYHNRTIHGPVREAQVYLTRKLRERDLGRDLEGANVTLNEYLDRRLETAVKPTSRSTEVGGSGAEIALASTGQESGQRAAARWADLPITIQTTNVSFSDNFGFADKSVEVSEGCCYLLLQLAVAYDYHVTPGNWLAP